MVGRAVETASLEAALDRARAGSGSVALFFGEAGVGKSHLLAVISSRARALGFTTMIGRCFADLGQRPFSPWREALGEDAIALERAETSLGPAEDRARSFERVLAALRARAEKHPLLVAIEDLQWADRDSLLLFLHAVRFGLSGALLLIGVVRTPDLDAARNDTLEEVLAELAREPRAELLRLRPFAEEQVAELAAEVAGGTVPQSLARTLHRETGGNALYVRELVRHLIEEGRIARQDGRLASDFAASELAIPPSIRHVVRRRIARLSDDAASLLRAASATSGATELATLAQASGVELDRAIEEIDRAIDGGLVRTRGGRYELSHAIVGRALYEELNPDRRARLHRRLAEALESRPGADPSELAAHYHASRSLPGSERGAKHAIAAAEAARATGAHERAAAFFAIAAELSPPLGAGAVAELQARLAVALAAALEEEHALRAAEQAILALSQCGEGARVPALIVELVRALQDGGSPRSVWDPLVARGLAALGPQRDATWARLTVLGRPLVPLIAGPVWISRFAPHDADAARTLRAEGSELDFAATVDTHDARTREESQSLRARIQGWSDSAAILRVLDACGRDLFFAGDPHAAVACMEELAARALEVGSPSGQVAADITFGCCFAALGELERGREALARARALSARLGSMHRMNAVGPFALEVILGHIGGGVDWSALAKRLLDFVSSPSAGRTPFGIVGLSVGLVAAAHAGDEATVLRLLPQHLRALELVPLEVNEWGAGRDCGATVVWQLGLSAHAPAYLALARRAPERTGCACWTSAVHSEARMLALSGELELARARFDEARAGFERTDRRPSLAICDYDEALALARAGRAHETTLLDRAEERFRALGMEPWIAAASKLRTELGARPPDGLTAREVEVLSLLAQGLANKEIAARLFISVPTVERHIANVYAKIGVNGRAKATAYAIAHGLARPST